MTLGSQDGPNNGEANDTDEIGAVLPNHETLIIQKKQQTLTKTCTLPEIRGNKNKSRF